MSAVMGKHSLTILNEAICVGFKTYFSALLVLILTSCSTLLLIPSSTTGVIGHQI